METTSINKGGGWDKNVGWKGEKKRGGEGGMINF